MSTLSTSCTAKEQRPIDKVVAAFPAQKRWLVGLMKRLTTNYQIAPGARIMDLGAAQGSIVAALTQLGYDSIGIEPWTGAIEVAKEFEKQLGTKVPVIEGSGEKNPLPNSSIDVALVGNVLEHVDDLKLTLSEIHRVLKPGGLFWFSTASALAYTQEEIRGYPLFPWYPIALKRKIMYEAVKSKPHLVGGTTKPAIHWYTPAQWREILADFGYTDIKDRWQLRLMEEESGIRRTFLKTVKALPPARFAADVLTSSLSFAAIKRGNPKNSFHFD